MDELVPPSHMDALLARCASDVKVWKSFAEGTHNDTCVKHGYFESIGLFLTTFIVPRTAGGAAAAAAATAASPSLVTGFALQKDEKLDALRIIETGQGTSSRSRSRSGSRAKLARSASTGSSSSSDARRRKTTAASGTAQGGRTHDSDAEWVEMSAKDAETAGPLT